MYLKTTDIVRISLSAALLCLCSWITVPGVVPYTLQNLGVVMFSAVLGGKNAVIAVLVYLLCGGIGLPVFSGFRGGAGVLLSATGGYLWGFVPLGGIVGYVCNRWGRGLAAVIASAVIGTMVCYGVGTLWYAWIFSEGKSVGEIMAVCVVPFVVPDLVKIIIGAWCVKRFDKYC